MAISDCEMGALAVVKWQRERERAIKNKERERERSEEEEESVRKKINEMIRFINSILPMDYIDG